jgi:Cutinase
MSMRARLSLPTLTTLICAVLVAAATAIGAGALAPSAQADDDFPCEGAVTQPWSPEVVQRCPLGSPVPPNGWVPVYSEPIARGKGTALPAPAGWLHGTTDQYFVCEQEFSSATFYHGRGWRNRWWAKTRSDDGVWGWTPEVFFRGGADDEPDRGLRSCGTLPQRPRSCNPHEVIGARGSGESLDGPYGMAGTVGPIAEEAISVAGKRRTRAVSLRYPALPVDVMLKEGGIRAFSESILIGKRLLMAEVRRTLRRCPRTRFGLIGYSQGAAVVSQALREMPRRYRAQVRAAVLVADPYSKGPSDYDLTLSPSTDEVTQTRLGHGALGPRSIPLPASRLADVCYAGDIVCDLNTGLPELVFNAMLAPVHSNYKNCCATRIQLTRVLGSSVGAALEGKRR